MIMQLLDTVYGEGKLQQLHISLTCTTKNMFKSFFLTL